MMKKTITVRVDPEVHERLKQEATAAKVSLNTLCLDRMTNGGDAMLILDYIKQLTSEEPSSVTIHHANPDFVGPNQVVECNRDGFVEPLSVGGESVLDCLRKLGWHMGMAERSIGG